MAPLMRTEETVTRKCGMLLGGGGGGAGGGGAWLMQWNVCGPDLFWAQRGSGGNYGVIISLTLQLYVSPVGFDLYDGWRRRTV